MTHQFLNDGEDKEVRSRPKNEPERVEGSHEEASADEAPGGNGADREMTTPAASRRQRRSKQEDLSESQVNADPEKTRSSSRDADMRELEARGFTPDEATRLIDLSVRINEVTLKRLQFTKWLVDQGLLDEFSLRD